MKRGRTKNAPAHRTSPAPAKSAGAPSEPAPHVKKRWGRVGLISALALGAVLAARPLWVRTTVLVDLDRARRSLAAADLERALEWLQAADERQGDHAETHYLLARVHRRSARFHEAKRHLERAHALGWPQEDLERQHWMMLFQMGNVPEAESYLTALLEAGASDELAEEVYEVLVTGYLTEFRVRDADVCLNHWLEWQPRSIPARVMRAHLLQSLRRDDEYVVLLREILSIDPARLTERLALASWLLENTQVDEAMLELETCAREAPGDARVLLALGICHFKRGAVEQAGRELHAAMSMKLDSRQAAEAFKTLGQIALAAADYDLAVRHFERAIELMPHSSDALYSLGTALNRMGQSDRGKHYLERSQVLLELDERLDEVGNQLTNDVGNTALRVKAANILLEMGDKTKAANYMLSALRYDPDLHSAHEMLAEYYREQGRGDLARQHRELARSPDAAK